MDYTELAKDNDLVLLYGPRGKKIFIRLASGTLLQTHLGQILHDDMIGVPWGKRIYTHLGRYFYLLQPNLNEILLNLKRSGAIMYPKDIGYVLMNLDISPGKRVIEAGTGSGGLTTVLATMVGDAGHVYSYETRTEAQNLAKKNIQDYGLEDRITFHNTNIQDGFLETGVDSLFLDVPNPEDYLDPVRQALKPGGYFGSLLPTTNQVTLLLEALHRNQFSFTEVCEVLLRFHKPLFKKFRPEDRMVAHTGFLIFSRPVEWSDNPESETK